MSPALVERFRQALFALTALLALGAAWVAGRNFRDPRLPQADLERLQKPFAPPKPARQVGRDDRTLKSFRALTERRLVPAVPEAPVAVGPPPFKLKGTTYNAKSPEESSAIVEDSRRDIRRYRPGQMVEADQAKLLAVTGLKARFLWRGQEIELGPDAPKPPVVIPSALPPRTEYTITPKEWAHYFERVNDYWNMVKVDANIVGGRKDGLRINFMDEKFPGRKYGFKEGDIVYKVNGGSLTSPMEMMGLFSSLKEPKPVSFEVERGGRRFTLTIRPEEEKR